jgi:hypothetical protein
MSKADALKKKMGKHSHECKHCGIKITDERECKSPAKEEQVITGEEKAIRRDMKE